MQFLQGQLRTHICAHRTAGANNCSLIYVAAVAVVVGFFSTAALPLLPPPSPLPVKKAPQRQQVARLASNKSCSRQSQIQCNIYALLRILVHKPTNSLLLHEQMGKMLMEEIECRAVKDEMLFIPHVKKAMPAEPLAVHVGCCHAALACTTEKLLEAAEAPILCNTNVQPAPLLDYSHLRPMIRRKHSI